MCVCGLFLKYSLSWPYLWRDQRTQGKERPPALLWSELLKKRKVDTSQTMKKGKGK